MASDTEGKWSCARCTYANFDCASSCTMCRGPKHPVFITEPPCTSSTACAAAGDSEHKHQDKWACTSCTYLNVPNARRCTLCSTEPPEHVSKKTVEKHVSHPKESEFDPDEASRMSKALRKWSCSQCTYQNWPSVVHCTMCASPKDFPPVPTTDETSGGTGGTASGWTSPKSDGPVNDTAAICTPTANSPKENAEKAIDPSDDASVDGSGVALTPPNSDLCKGAQKSTESKVAEKPAKTVAKVEDVHPCADGDGLSMLQAYIAHLHKTIDTGCASFLEAVHELITNGSESDSKLQYYMYHYGDGSRRINTFESILLGGIEELEERSLIGRTLVDIVESRPRSNLTNMPRFFLDSATLSAVLPGLCGEALADKIHKNLREEMDEDYDMSRMTNNVSMFIPPKKLYDLKPWIASGDHNLRIVMDFEERQVMASVCCSDLHSLSSPVARQTYAPLILRNRGGGHSLVDAASQALWGVVDKDNLLRDAIFNTLYMKQTMFRSRWASARNKSGVKLDIWALQQYWSRLLQCHEPGSPLEQIHVLVLAQVLNRPILVLPIESNKLNPFPAREGQHRTHKHPMEGFYPQLPGLNNYRLCSPLLLGYTNGMFHALVMPPPARSPLLSIIKATKSTRIFRHIKSPPLPLSRMVQFALSENEAEDFIRDSLVVDVDAGGQQWIYHSTISLPFPKRDVETKLWDDWIAAHFPRSVNDEDCEEEAGADCPADPPPNDDAE